MIYLYCCLLQKNLKNRRLCLQVLLVLAWHVNTVRWDVGLLTSDKTQSASPQSTFIATTLIIQTNEQDFKYSHLVTVKSFFFFYFFSRYWSVLACMDVQQCWKLSVTDHHRPDTTWHTQPALDLTATTHSNNGHNINMSLQHTNT